MKTAIKELKEFAKSKNLSIRFRNTKTDESDFCIFIYGPTQKRYLIGFDGWNDSSVFTFEKIVEQAKNYIDNYEKFVGYNS